MEFLIFIALVVVFIIVLNIQSSQRSNADDLNKSLSSLNRQLQELKNEFINLQFKTPEVKPAPTEQQQKEKAAAELQAQEEYKRKIAAIEELRLLREARKKEEEEKQLLQQPATLVAINETIEPPKIKVTAAPPAPPKESWSEKWIRNNPDIEKFIGENLISKIGIGILVLAIGFFVNYAIDQNWIGPVGRVAIGILCGGILIALAHKLRNTYKNFSSILAGGGLAVFYFTITLAFQKFHLFGQTNGQAIAFIIMVVITAFAVILSLLYNKQELAIVALVGGFTAPFLVSTGDGNYKVLFTYLIILNSGLLIIAYNKAWRILNFLSFIFTIFIFGSWLFFLRYDVPAVTYKNGFLFATAFYLLFFIINIAHNIKEKKKFIGSDFGILLANTSLYFGAGIFCLAQMNAPEFKGLFSASMGIFNLIVSYFLFRKQKVDTNILYLLIGITLTFISITAPIQLHGNYITLFWASEAVLLYWLFTKSKISIMQYSALLVWALMMISLVMDWMQLYTHYSTPLTIIANKGFITTVFAAIATYLLFVLRNKETENINPAAATFIPGKNIFRIVAIILLFAAGALEINYQFNFYYPAANFHILYLLLYTLAFISLLTFITQKVKPLQLHWQIIAIMFAGSIIFYFLSIPQTIAIQKDVLELHKNNEHFLAHWASALLALSVLYRLIQLLRSKRPELKDSFNFLTWVSCAAIVIYLSIEFHLLSNNIFYAADNPLSNIQRIYIKTGLPILWGLCSFAFMWLGMHFKYRSLRIISLSLFTLTLLKLFIFDIQNIPPGGKIAAFFCLGILLLVVSFMYQRLKKIIIDDEKKVD
ncbi:DUF2339 domain-containing protein [Ferruginibacter sp. SUN106]|uniref:DUF2339 domain-containing protein n=1 Tax=Ferruginibacter sp. SUN106 TaxID=2978348 RepID=UPI003D36E722